MQETSKRNESLINVYENEAHFLRDLIQKTKSTATISNKEIVSELESELSKIEDEIKKMISHKQN